MSVQPFDYESFSTSYISMHPPSQTRSMPPPHPGTTCRSFTPGLSWVHFPVDGVGLGLVDGVGLGLGDGAGLGGVGVTRLSSHTGSLVLVTSLPPPPQE